MSDDALPLRWGVKRSLIRYLSGVDDASLVASDGATADTDHIFRFEPVGADDGTRRFRGSLTFTAYDGMLLIQLADPWIEYDDDGLLLSVFSPMDERRVPTARLTGDGDESWTASLLPRGADLLGPQYTAGTEVDPVRIA